MLATLYDFLHLLGSQRRDRRSRRMRGLVDREMVEIGVAIQVGCQHPFVADDTGHRTQRAVHLRGTHSWWQSLLHAIPAPFAGCGDRQCYNFPNTSLASINRGNLQ